MLLIELKESALMDVSMTLKAIFLLKVQRIIVRLVPYNYWHYTCLSEENL